MKRFVPFLILLSSSLCIPAFACGLYYPYGEEVRFNLLHPKCFQLPDYSLFNYTAALYDYTSGNPDEINESGYQSGLQANLVLWQQRCQNKPSREDVYAAVYAADRITANEKDENSFIRYLSVQKDVEAIRYLNFAKSCEPYNGFLDDPWEREEIVKMPQRERLIRQAESEANRLSDPDLKCRYAFLAIRLAYYNQDEEVIRRLYQTVFGKAQNKNIIYYWSTYFYCLTPEDGAVKNYRLAQVFANAPDKRFAVCQYTDRKIPIESVLSKASGPLEKSAVYLLYAVRNAAQGLPVLQKMYENTPGFEGLDFLLLREVNKLEDWICTPYYTELGPALYGGKNFDGWWGENERNDKENIMLQRIREDRKYAREVLGFIKKADFRKVHDPALWQTAKLYLLFMAGDYAAVLNEIHSPWLKTLNPDGLVFIQKLEALTLTAHQKAGEAVLLDPVKTALMKYDDDPRFIFAVGRELEFKQNTTDAALLYSKKNKNTEEDPDWDFSGVCWRTKLRHCTLYADFYTGYFFYMDAQYTPEQVGKLIEDIQRNGSKPDSFSVWKYGRVKSKIDRLYDLLGTKYMRQDKLDQAFRAFQSVNDTLWNSNVYAYRQYLDANPFYTDFYTEHQSTPADTITYNKRELVEKILDLLQKAGNAQNPDRDYDYFLLGNAYFNMTQYGNSWMMKRYYWTSNATPTKLEDDEDYFGCLHAKDYYLKAKETTKNKKFAALCLRMAGRCEGYFLSRQYYATHDYWNSDFDRVNDQLFAKNKYYRQIARNYPEDYDDLISHCESFSAYFQERK